MANQKLQVWLPLLFSIVMIIGMFSGYKMRDALPGKSFFYTERPTSLQEITELLNKRYVDPVDIKMLTDTAVQAMIAKLDPHSFYIPPAELQEVNESIQGSFYGIGIEFTQLEDSLNVVNVLPGGPSEKAGIKIGDILLAAGDSLLSGNKIPRERIRNILRGPEGSILKVTILRNGKKIQTELSRGEIPINTVDASYMLTATSGYIRLDKFSAHTYKEFMIALMDLKKQGLKDLILDLRGNGGGVLEEAVEIADEFLDGDKLITYTEGLHSPKKEYRCRRNGQFEQGKLVVLADENTASASEVLLGAVQDWDRATIIGRRSFGKGLVQEQFNLSNGAALRLTIARYFTPVGRSIQRSYKNGTKSYYSEIAGRYNDGEMVSADSVKNDTTKVFYSMGHKKLYGSGGISPDVFVAADTAHLSMAMAKIYSRGTLSDFGYRYYRLHAAELAQYKTTQQYISSFRISSGDRQYFESLAAKDSVNTAGISAKERSLLDGNLKSIIAQQLFHTAGFLQTVNVDDEAIKKALQVLALP